MGRHKIPGLTPAELQVLKIIAKGLNYTDSTALYGKSRSTWTAHRWRIAKKLNAKGTCAIIYKAMSLGLLTPADLPPLHAAIQSEYQLQKSTTSDPS